MTGSIAELSGTHRRIRRLSAVLLFVTSVALAPVALGGELTLDAFIPGGRVAAPFGLARPGLRDHTGVDVAAPTGTAIAAPDDALVVEATDLFRGEPRHGKVVVLEFADDLVAWFTHLDDYRVKPGDRLAKGETFATVGRTGGSSSSHVHIETYRGAAPGTRVDPATVWRFLQGEQVESSPRPAIAANVAAVSYAGYAPETIADIYRGKWRLKEVRLAGELILPDGPGPFPVVVLQHGSGHRNVLDSWWRYLVPALNEAGIGAFIADSYGGRRLADTSGDQGRLSKAARIVDALMALKALSQMPQVDPARIGITGYSFGGAVALETADRRIVESVLGPGLRFAGHLPVYPNCTDRESLDMTGAPIRFLLAGADDYTPPEPCRALITKLAAAGFAVSQTTYPSSGHGFVLVRERFLERAATFRNCAPVVLTRDGYLQGDGFSDRGGSWSDFVAAAFRKCGTRGAHVAGTEESRRRARDDTVRFFRTVLRP